MNGSAAPNANGLNRDAAESSFLEAAASAAETIADIESQQSAQQASAQIDAIDIKPDEEATISTFQDDINTRDPNNCWILNDDDKVPFPSVNEPEEMNEMVNVCPCRCLFFTLKETICMVMSALGCAVFVTGLVFLCMFLEGSWFEQY